jgi:hypothetical protein
MGAHVVNSPGKNLADSNRRGEFVNDFDHTRRLAAGAMVRKIVDSSSVSQKACPERVFEGPECGKAEEGSGKKGSDFLSRESKKLTICQRNFSVGGGPL